MGYVRMIKAGGLHFVSNSIRFVPDLDDIPNFEQLTIEDGLQNDTIGEAAKTLDEVVANLVKNFSDSTEYFQVSREELLSFLVFSSFCGITVFLHSYYCIYFLFQLLVNVFGKQLHEDKHPHLKNFYVIVPPLTINYVEHMIAAKEKMNKNIYSGAAFTDDGLAMGKMNDQRFVIFSQCLKMKGKFLFCNITSDNSYLVRYIFWLDGSWKK